MFSGQQRQPRGDGGALARAGGDGELATVEQGALVHSHQPEVTLPRQIGRLLRRDEADPVIPYAQDQAVGGEGDLNPGFGSAGTKPSSSR